MFCFNCGVVGHNEDKCDYPVQPIPEGGANPRGPWLRSNIYGKRVEDNKDKRFNSNPLQSVSGGQFSPIPQEMLDMLAKMKLEEEAENHTSSTAQTHTTSNLQQSPIETKRKFHKITQNTQHVTQFIHGNSSSSSSKATMVSLAEKANQGQ
jgi:hypothetical protein